MPAYGDMDIAIAGLIAEGIQHSSIRSRVAKQEITYGNPVFGYLGDAVGAYNYALDTAKLVFDADFVTSNTIDITVNGEAISTVTFDTDHDTTAAAVLAAIQALTITDSVLGDVSVDAILDPADANNRTFYIRTKGLDITVTEDVQAGAGQATGTITYQSDQVFAGVATFVQRGVKSISEGSLYEVDTAVTVMERGILYAFVNSTPSADDDAYIDNAGSDKGAFASSGDDPGCKFRSGLVANPTTGDNLAKVEVRGIKKLNAEIAWS